MSVLYFSHSHLVRSLLSHSLPRMNFCSLIIVHLPIDFCAPLDSRVLPLQLCCSLRSAAQILAVFSLFSPPSALYLEAGSLIPTPGGTPYHHRVVNVDCTYKSVVLLSSRSCFPGSFRKLLLTGRGGISHARRRGDPCWERGGR